MHTRTAYSRSCCLTVPFLRNSLGFSSYRHSFMQAVHFVFRIAEVPRPVRTIADRIVDRALYAHRLRRQDGVDGRASC